MDNGKIVVKRSKLLVKLPYGCVFDENEIIIPAYDYVLHPKVKSKMYVSWMGTNTAKTFYPWGMIRI